MQGFGAGGGGGRVTVFLQSTLLLIISSERDENSLKIKQPCVRGSRWLCTHKTQPFLRFRRII